MTTNQKGNIAELKVASRLSELGFQVLVPWGDARYDLVAERDGNFIKLQVKYATANAGRFYVRRTSVNRNGHARYEEAEVDKIAVYCPESDGVYFFPLDGSAMQHVWIEPPEVLRKDMHFAADYAELI